MRERITFIHSPAGGVDPAKLDIQAAGLVGPLTHVAREDRITLTLDELPVSLAALLRDVNDVHIKWSSTQAYDTLEPYVARISPGLHISYTPSGRALDTR